MSLDITAIEAPGATGYYNSAFHAKAATVCDALTQQQGYEFGLLHVKAVDDTGHDRRVHSKVQP